MRPCLCQKLSRMEFHKEKFIYLLSLEFDLSLNIFKKKSITFMPQYFFDMIVYKTSNQLKFKIYVNQQIHQLRSKLEYYKSEHCIKEHYIVPSFCDRLKLVAKDQTKINTIKACRKNFIRGGYSIGDINIDAQIRCTISIPTNVISRKIRNT